MCLFIFQPVFLRLPINLRLKRKFQVFVHLSTCVFFFETFFLASFVVAYYESLMPLLFQCYFFPFALKKCEAQLNFFSFLYQVSECWWRGGGDLRGGLEQVIHHAGQCSVAVERSHTPPRLATPRPGVADVAWARASLWRDGRLDYIG